MHCERQRPSAPATLRQVCALLLPALSISLSGAQKPPATSELIDWVKVLYWQGEKADALTAGQTPYWKVLFKTMQDLEAFNRLQK